MRTAGDHDRSGRAAPALRDGPGRRTAGTGPRPRGPNPPVFARSQGGGGGGWVFFWFPLLVGEPASVDIARAAIQSVPAARFPGASLCDAALEMFHHNSRVPVMDQPAPQARAAGLLDTLVERGALARSRERRLSWGIAA